jgi:hypothetical protein
MAHQKPITAASNSLKGKHGKTPSLAYVAARKSGMRKAMESQILLWLLVVPYHGLPDASR